MSCKSLKKHKLADDIGTEMLIIGVGSGDKRQEFKLHKALLRKCTGWFDDKKMFDTLAGKQGLIFLTDEDPDAFGMLVKWAYSGDVEQAVTRYTMNLATATPAAIQRKEMKLLENFDEHICNLIDLYSLAEKYEINDLMNNTIDAIQDGYHKYGTVFGPGSTQRIFEKTKHLSKLRDLGVGTLVVHLDRGCCQLRDEIVMVSLLNPDFFQHMLLWVSRNFVIFGRREREGFDASQPDEGFSMLNRSKLCPCHFHVHTEGEAHKDHKHCAIPYISCSHEKKEDATDDLEIGVMSLEE